MLHALNRKPFCIRKKRVNFPPRFSANLEKKNTDNNNLHQIIWITRKTKKKKRSEGSGQHGGQEGLRRRGMEESTHREKRC